MGLRQASGSAQADLKREKVTSGLKVREREHQTDKWENLQKPMGVSLTAMGLDGQTSLGSA